MDRLKIIRENVRSNLMLSVSRSGKHIHDLRLKALETANLYAETIRFEVITNLRETLSETGDFYL